MKNEIAPTCFKPDTEAFLTKLAAAKLAAAKFDNVDDYGHASDVDPQLALRAPPELVARVDRLAESLTRSASGARVTRSSAARVALERGLAAIEAELAAPPSPTPPEEP